MALSEIVNVNITKETTTVSRAGFGTLLIVGPDVNIDNRFALFNDATSAIKKIIGGASSLLLAQINAIFAQNPQVIQIALGALQAPKIMVNIGDITAGSISATVNGTLITEAFNIDNDTTFANLAISIAALSDVATAVYVGGTNTMTITPAGTTAIGVIYDITSATGIVSITETSGTPSESYTAALGEISIINNDWYGLAIQSRVTADQDLASIYIEVNKKLFGAGSNDSNIVDQDVSTDTTSIAALAKNSSRERTFVIYSKNADTQGIETAFFGKILPFDPGTYTAMFKTLALITVDILTPTQVTNALAKFVNIYQNIGSVNMTRHGQVSANEFIDIVIFIDWLEARITESVFSSLVNALKVPYTEPGLLIIEVAINQPLAVGQNRGGISTNEFDDDGNQIGGYFIIMPDFASIPSVDKTARLLQGVEFTAFLSGAIHKVIVNGKVTN